ncbi:hypothetical protein DY262_02885 [Hydrogenophaga borbori]|uniref:Uncharacterized protein n=1 Tax=Hydrogenophaga borbori TaxID=2294117 RepID=A0A372EQ85_9BURK|nr:hypothetical protein DY262_02885 [Hydrogenophaga borbori]
MKWNHPRRAARDPLQGAAPAARQSRFRGASWFDPGKRCGSREAKWLAKALGSLEFYPPPPWRLARRAVCGRGPVG